MNFLDDNLEVNWTNNLLKISFVDCQIVDARDDDNRLRY